MSGADGHALRVLELFAGIGGVAAALAGRVRVVAAVDQSEPALEVYRANHPHPTIAGAVQGLGVDRFRSLNADLWWLSPPCQPFTRRGRRRDLDDPRSAGLRAVLSALATVRPPFVALENVPGFGESRARDALHRALDRAGYRERIEVEDCPSRHGWPNLRRRYYLLAALEPGTLRDPPAAAAAAPSLGRLLDPDPDPGLGLDPVKAARYEGALDVVDPDDPAARTACFTSAYGRSIVRSGSYLRRSEGGLRRFSPEEILLILGFPETFRLPPGISRRKAWSLVGNSLSLPPVAALLGRIARVGNPLGVRSGPPAAGISSRE